MKKAFSRALRVFLAFMDILWVLGALAVCIAWWIGWWYRDETPLTTWLYFIPPLGVILFGYLWLFLTLKRRFRLVQLFVFATIAMCFVKVLLIDHRWHPPPETLPDDNLRLLHWNTAWGVLGVESIVRSIAHDGPDIVVISEPPRLDMISDIAYHALGMAHVFTDSGITVASHYPIAYGGALDIDTMVAWHVRIDTDRGPLELCAVDMVSRPNFNRRPSLKKLADWVAARTNGLPLLMVGDFNTPHDSLAFGPLREHLGHAYEQGGRLWPYSWPVPVPVFAIDHIWANDRVRINDYFLKTTKYSDHKRQIADFSLLPAKPTDP